MQETINFQSNTLTHGGWKYYNIVKKKAMGQEFSSETGGLLISLSIAFFVVLATAQILNITYQSMSAAENKGETTEQKIYYLEDTNRLNINMIKYGNLV